MEQTMENQQEMAKKLRDTIRNAVIISSLAALTGCAGLATALYQDSPFGEIDMARQRARASQININNQGQQNPYPNYPVGYVKHGKIPPKCNEWLTNDPDDLKIKPENTHKEGVGWFPNKGYTWVDNDDLDNVCTMKLN